MNEDELKTKWCPHVRLKTGSNITRDEKPFMCIGSLCSQYRVITAQSNSPRRATTGGPIDELRESIRYSGPISYCGLAGKPQ